MTEQTKKKIKSAATVFGCIGGSFAGTYATNVLTTICPPIGITGKIGQMLIGTVVAEKCAMSVSSTADGFINGLEAGKKAVEKVEEIMEDAQSEEIQVNIEEA